MRSKKVHVVTGSPACEVGRYQRRGEWHGRLRQGRCAGVRRVWREDGTRRSALGMALREHLLRVRVWGPTHALTSARPCKDAQTGRNTRRRALSLECRFQTLRILLVASLADGTR